MLKNTNLWIYSLILFSIFLVHEVGLHAQENPETRAGVNTPTHYNIT